eukprot:gene19167-22808_t
MKFKPLLQTKYLWITIIILSIIAIAFKSAYRQYIYANKINDYGIADSSPNFFAGLIIVFFYFTQYQKLTLKKHAIFTVVGLIGYELIQGSVFKHNFFDYKDIFASLLGAFIGYLIGSKFKSGPIFNDMETEKSNKHQCASGQEKQSLQKNIPIIFNEIKVETKKGHGLWNKNLYGPILLVDPKTREVFANQADTSGLLKYHGGIFSGVLPPNINIANTAVNFSGKRWAMLMLPLSQNKKDRINLLAHELFHTAQPSLGFVLYNPENNHLDQKNGRIYLRLELEALKKAVQCSTKKEVQQYLTNALTFRKYRHLQYPGSDTTENLLEINEGIAEFTGVIVSARTKKQQTEHFVNGLSTFLNNATFVRSFAYQTVPIYGYLLYAKNKNWNKEITIKTNLTDYFIRAFNITIPSNLKESVERLSNSDDGKMIIQQETAREEKTKKLIAEYKFKFIEQPHFEIQFEKMNVSFDPKNIMPIEDKGTVYP